MASRLQSFATKCDQESLFVSFVVLYPETRPLTEKEFESFLWQRLQALHELDARNFGWAEEVSADAESPHFSMSVGGKAFYVVGLHPGASRPARRFPTAALVFNLHSQFELLKNGGSYDDLAGAIWRRDVAANGNSNPMLADHGESSEARQYSGRKVDAAWKCPFHAVPMKAS